MTDYDIKNTARVGKSYVGDNGERIEFEPGQVKELKSLPPEVDDVPYNGAGWRIESADNENSKSEDTVEGGEN